MERFFGAFQLDRLSFWLGFLAASLFWWLLARLRPLLPRARAALQDRARAARHGLAAGEEGRLRSDTLRLAQRSHLAAILFPLDEILIQPRLLLVRSVEPGAPSIDDICTQTLPDLPDWPELAAAYGVQSIPLAEALANRANLVITGLPGSGKTVALASLASIIARQDPLAGELAVLIPVLVHASDLPHTARRGEEDPLDALVEAVLYNASPLSKPRLPASLRAAFQNGRAILLLDGLDEYPAAKFLEFSAYLGRLLQIYPSVRVVTTASPDCYPGLPELGFIPVALAAWDERQRQSFIRQWSRRWNQAVPPQAGDPPAAERLILDEWLLNDPAFLTPLELTLKAWGAYAGDTLGPGVPPAIEAYLRRMAAGIPKARPALEKIAVQMILEEQAAAERQAVESWVREFDPSLLEPGAGAEPAAMTAPRVDAARAARKGLAEPITAPRILPALLERGLLQAHRDGWLSLAHAVLAGYLAGCGLRPEVDGPGLLAGGEKQSLWAGRALAVEFLAAGDADSQLPAPFIEQSQGPFYWPLQAAARWIRSAPEAAPWKGLALRRLAGLLQDETHPFELRARAMTALATSGSPGVEALFRQALAARDAALRQLAALGLGLSRDAKAVAGIGKLLSDPGPNVRRAACLALVRIGDKEALDTVADGLLRGDEDLRRAAAEALAGHPQEGHPILKEGSRIDDLLVRRAVIFGLLRAHEPWAIETLKKMEMEDGQWVVKNAAAQALETLERPDPRPPRPWLPLHKTPWLIAFAGQRGMGIAPGKAAVDLLLLAIREGDEEQRLAALERAGRSGEPRSLPAVYEACSTARGELHTVAYQALWRLAAAGAY